MNPTSKKSDHGAVWLGIDPGTTIIGYGAIRAGGNKHACLDYGIISNPGKDRPTDLQTTYASVLELIEKHSPVGMAVERLFFAKNQKTVMPVSEMRGVILLAAAHKNLPVIEYTPLQVKSLICNYGQADKDQVRKMVMKILSLTDNIRPDDAADALALAVCGSLAKV